MNSEMQPRCDLCKRPRGTSKFDCRFEPLGEKFEHPQVCGVRIHMVDEDAGTAVGIREKHPSRMARIGRYNLEKFIYLLEEMFETGARSVELYKMALPDSGNVLRFDAFEYEVNGLAGLLNSIITTEELEQDKDVQ